MINEDSMRELYGQAFREDPSAVTVTKAPGRVNLIGEHTDYNDGFVMPVPIDRHVWVAAKEKDGNTVNLHAADYGENASFKLDDVRFDSVHLWANYVIGVADVLMGKGYPIGGANMVISGDVPIGAGLSSSAAMEVATVRVFADLFDLRIDPLEMAYIGKSAENNFVGVQSGIMDQFVGSLGRKDHALFIDCRTNEYRHIPLDPDYTIVIVNTMVRRELTTSDVTPEDFEQFKETLPEVIAKRCRHVVYENARVIEAVEALESGDMERFGGLMYESHSSLRHDYEVSSTELDFLVETARGLPGTAGARMTGAGFGGCTVNIVESEKTEDFVEAIQKNYLNETGFKAEVYLG
jgi:galactokinase